MTNQKIWIIASLTGNFEERSQISLSKKDIVHVSRTANQQAFTCSKSAKETLEKGVKYVQI